MKNMEDIIQWTSTESWISKDDFLKNGFGFCIVNGNDIVSWCISDYVMGNKCEIGIETDEGYRKNGFATIVVSVCIKYCMENNIDHIWWHCFESNIGSQKTAEKVGFKLCKEYKPLFGWYNSFDNFLVHAYDYYTNKHYAEASKLYEKAFRLLESNNKESKISNICNENNKYWFYFNAARANAYINNIDLAYDKLKKSIERGLSDKNMIINDDAFKKLINLNDFCELMHINI
ncbi:GNAT family N-acetyltransferase [Hathewaya proteolytica]|nr:GNAT family N-acetyltransferase [Hathewaya proteolytica]